MEDLGNAPTVADTPARSTFDAGALLGNRRYRIVRQIGKGGMGRVFLAVDEALGKEVALKLVDERVADRLRDEVRLAQQVTHANVCRTHDLEEIDGQWLVKMEYIAGDVLADRLKQGPLPVAQAVAIASSVCAGLAAAHRQGVVHRDLKPHNIMVEAATGRVVLMDFGIARVATLAGQTAEQVAGTPEYMAPEQVRGREVDARADLYALGCVLYEMLTGRRVFPRPSVLEAALAHVNDPPPAVPERVPERLRRLVARLLEKDPARRPATADEVAAALAGPRRRQAFLLAAAVMLSATVVALVATRPARRWEPRIRDLPQFDEASDQLVLSPDAKLYAFNSDREERGRYRVYVAPLDGGPARAVTPRETNAGGFLRWQRDGAALLVNVDRDLYRVPVAGGTPRLFAKETTFAEDCGGGRLVMRISRRVDDRTRIVFVVREPDGATRDLVVFPNGFYFPDHGRCDRPGRRFAYSLADSPLFGAHEPYDLWIVDVAGGEPRRLTSDHAGWHGVFSGDGRTIVASAARGGQPHLWEIPTDGKTAPRQLTFGAGGEILPDLSADGRLLLYQIGGSTFQLYAQPLAGGPARKLTPSLDEVMIPRPTPDGHEIIAQSSSASSLDAQIVRIPAEGGEPVTIVPGESPAISPDGAQILYVAQDCRVMALPIGGGTPRLVTAIPGRIRYVHVVGDGLVHVQVQRQSGLEAWSAPLAGGAARRELEPPWAAWRPAPRGGWAVGTRWNKGLGLRRARFVPPGARFDDPGNREIEFYGKSAWTPDGAALLYVQANGTLHRYEVATGADSVVAHGNFEDVALSPDGKTLYTTQPLTLTRRELITNFADRQGP